MVKNKQNNMAIEDLAVLIQRTMASKEDLQKLATKEDLQKLATKDEVHDLRGTMRDIVEELNATHADVRYIRNTVNKLVQSDIAQDTAIQGLTSRVHRLEQKTGLAK